MTYDPVDPANDPEAEYWGYSIYDEDEEEIPGAFDWEYDWRCPDCGDEECPGGCNGVYDGP